MIEKLVDTDGILSELMYERAKQIGKGYDAVHDDNDKRGNQARAAAYYATVAHYQRCWGYDTSDDSSQFERIERERQFAQRQADEDSVGYPWSSKTKSVEYSPRANLIKAAALLIAEIERIDREERAQ